MKAKNTNINAFEKDNLKQAVSGSIPHLISGLALSLLVSVIFGSINSSGTGNSWFNEFYEFFKPLMLLFFVPGIVLFYYLLFHKHEGCQVRDAYILVDGTLIIGWFLLKKQASYSYVAYLVGFIASSIILAVLDAVNKRREKEEAFQALKAQVYDLTSENRILNAENQKLKQQLQQYQNNQLNN